MGAVKKFHLVNMLIGTVAVLDKKSISYLHLVISIYLEVITRLFLYQPVYQALASITARGVVPRVVIDQRLDIGLILKQPCDNIFII